MPYDGKYVCITGVVQNDLSISEGSVESFGYDFRSLILVSTCISPFRLDLANFNKVIQYSIKSPMLFHTV